ncbi:MAG: alanine--tRNA ligase [Candidatus Levybacteria bacterium]|nr:alanine--tRNA ligase [Candidatus Levybacteria bacterium]
MLTAQEIIDVYISFFEKLGHKRILNSPLVPENDPTTLFTSSGMQPLIPYLLGEPHPLGKRLVNVQNSFRAGDIEEVGDNRHTTFFRMIGNWSLGDYFKKEQIPWIFEFFTKELKISAQNLYVSVFHGFEDIPKDEESANIWEEVFEKVGLETKNRIFYYDAQKNWWTRSGLPQNMPIGEPGGPDSEVFYEFEDVEHNPKYGEKCHPNCQCGRFLEIGNSVFMTYKKTVNGFSELSQKNVDFGAGLERILAVVEKKSDIFTSSLFSPIVKTIETQSSKSYEENAKNMRIITDHFVASVFIANAGVIPSNKEQGYILRRLIRRGLDNFYQIQGKEIEPVVEAIVEQYKTTDSKLVENFEKIKNVILLEKETYKKTLERAKKFITKKYQTVNGDLMGVTKISADDAFLLYSTHGLSPTQIKSLGFEFDEQEFAKKMEKHQALSRKGASQKFAGGLADHSETVTKFHTATHLLHTALRQILGTHVQQKGSNITAERLRFDFSNPQNLTLEELKKVEDLVNKKIEENLPVSFEIMSKENALKSGALGFFVEKYENKVKVYTIGNSVRGEFFSREICGGPHIDFTKKLKRFKIIKQENIGSGNRRIYAVLET